MNAGETSLLLASELIWDNNTINVASTIWYLQDHQNSVRDIVYLNSGGTLILAGHNVFDSFGNLTYVWNVYSSSYYTGDAAKQYAFGRYLYTSQEYDATVDLYYYNNNRWYDA